MAVHRRYDIIAIVIAVICIAGYASFRSEFRLRRDMPREFFDGTTVRAQVRAPEERVAKAYWNRAVMEVQWKYGYAHRLPEEPPAEFAVTEEEAGSAAYDPALRAHYWQRLRQVWTVSSVWQEKFEWNTISLRQSLQSAGAWLELQMRRIIGYS